jgi:hypothetical protein
MSTAPVATTTSRWLLVLGLALAPGLALADGANACQASSGAQTGALVELYTSEGCSSCPPADRWFGELAAHADPRQESLLAFHVDYWDELGWRDRYSRHAYTQRQSNRVGAAGSKTIYTPQVMLSSELGLHWYQPQEVASALAAIQRQPSKLRIDLAARADDAQWRVAIRATPTAPVSANAALYLALYEDDIVSHVKAGENGGATLHHDRVVRGLWGPWPVTAKGAARDLQVTLPGDARAAKSGLTAFVQDGKSGQTLQALSLPLGNCGP